MSAAPKLPADSVNLIIPDLLPACVTALKAAEQLLGTATAAVAQLVRGVDGRIDAARLEEEQFATHGLAWLATYRSEEHPSELQSLMRISYAVFCLTKKKTIYAH